MNRILIVGCGDVAKRLLPWLKKRFRVFALVRQERAAREMRSLGVVPVFGDLDSPRSLRRVGVIADRIVHCAPPPDFGTDDTRTRNLLAALARARTLPRRLVYISTTGVYGDCKGALVFETQPAQPRTPRARRRVSAELRLRAFSASSGAGLAILRAPGIYAPNRLPLARLERGDPVLSADEDVITNHIHADDLAHAAGLAVFRGKGIRIYNACDDSQIKMGDYYDAMADLFRLPRPPRLSRQACAQTLSASTLSFMAESRRLSNTRIKRELRWSPSYPDVLSGLRAALHTIRFGEV